MLKNKKLIIKTLKDKNSRYEEKMKRTNERYEEVKAKYHESEEKYKDLKQDFNEVSKERAKYYIQMLELEKEKKEHQI